MRNLLLFIVFGVVALFPVRLSAQFYSEKALSDTAFHKISDRKLGLKINSTAFFKNNEYFHRLVEGYTLPGFIVQPVVYYDINNKVSLEAGVSMSKFSGQHGLDTIMPVFRAKYKPVDHFSILLGWLQNKGNHNLIEPLYQWEQLYTKPVENGVQFIYEKKNFVLDTWIDWERYIEFNDPFQEELTFGTTTKTALGRNEGSEWWIPVQLTIKHKGGQIISIDEPITSIANYVAGINYLSLITSSYLRRIMIDLYYVGYNDFSPQKRLPFKRGYGIYPVVTANYSAFTTSLGYWRAHKFISSKGEPLLQCVSVTNPEITIPDRYVITFKTSYYKEIFKDVSFAAYFESYYDLHKAQMDYDYGISISVSGDILFKQLF